MRFIKSIRKAMAHGGCPKRLMKPRPLSQYLFGSGCGLVNAACKEERERGGSLYTRHHRVSRAQPNHTRKVLQSKLGIAQPDPKPAACVPCRCEIWIKGQCAIY